MINKTDFELEYGAKDIHGHIGTFATFNVPDADGEALNSAIMQSGIEEVCVAPFIGLSNDCSLANRVSQALSEKFPSIRGLALVNPYNIEESERELQFCFEENSFAAIKLHPSFNHRSDNDKGYESALSYANKHRIAVLWHYGGGDSYLAELSKRYPDANFILAHYGTCWDGFADGPVLDTLKLVARYDNVYTDLAGSACYYEAVPKVVNIVSHEKLLFGSDICFLDGAYQLGNIIRAKIPEKAKYAILKANYERLVKPKRTGL